MRSLIATLSFVLLLVVSFTACKKQQEAQNQQPASNQSAADTTSTAPAENPGTSTSSTTLATTTQPGQTEPVTPAPAGPTTTSQPSATQPSAGQPPAKPTTLAGQKFPIKPGMLPAGDRDSIAGTWRGMLSKSHALFVFHFNADGWGSLDIPQRNLHLPVSLSKFGDTVQIAGASGDDKFLGKIKDRKMTGAWIQKTSSEELQLTKD